MKIATWNINSIRARLPHLLQWLETDSPDVVLLQETKTPDATFPFSFIEDLGYNIAHSGQKSYNGVAILSKKPLEDVERVLPGDLEDSGARYLEAVIGDTRVISLYVPNGQEVGSLKFQYKLRYYERLYDHFKNLLKYNEKLVIGGDFNVAPTDNDVYNPAAWEGSVLVSPQERAHFRMLTHLGLADAWVAKHGNAIGYTWWDYRKGAFHNDRGLRIDHFLLSPPALDCLVDIGVHKEIRTLERPSDHAPVWCTLK